MLLPVRMAVLYQLSKVDIISVNEMMEVLKSEYSKERQFNYKTYFEHFMALEANKFISLERYELKDGEIEFFYKITEDGLIYVQKYILKK